MSCGWKDSSRCCEADADGGASTYTAARANNTVQTPLAILTFWKCLYHCQKSVFYVQGDGGGSKEEQQF